ncbi:MAG: hypothetical protein ACHP84_12195 [Caulobacterales bacterium]
MTEPIQPVRRANRTRPYGRRAADQPDAAAPASTAGGLPAPVPLPARSERRAAAPPIGDGAKPAAAFAAQVIAGGPRRGLKGGPERLETAKAAYLETEFSGPADRRPVKGRITKTEI